MFVVQTRLSVCVCAKAHSARQIEIEMALTLSLSLDEKLKCYLIGNFWQIIRLMVARPLARSLHKIAYGYFEIFNKTEMKRWRLSGKRVHTSNEGFSLPVCVKWAKGLSKKKDII